ncbi:MAG: glycoside hydrolase family 78 protein [Tannerella sp.]|jgi:hypothetical protein|nr:glycoside hydrolase family 78 protein [Tannerella sp.]
MIGQFQMMHFRNAEHLQFITADRVFGKRRAKEQLPAAYDERSRLRQEEEKTGKRKRSMESKPCAMKTCLFVLCMYLLAAGEAAGQLLPELNYPQVQYGVTRWDAKWVTCDGIAEADYAVVMFRRAFTLPEKPAHFVVHVSADNRYKLYVNGTLAVMGPQGSDWRHWRYETVDLAPYLQAGDNVITAEVVNWGPDRFFGIMSIRTAFMMQGETQAESLVNTTAGSPWKACRNEAYRPVPVNWIYGVDVVGGFYATNPGDSITLAAYPQDWTSPSFDDSAWLPAKWIWNISNEGEGGFFWLMKPRTTPQVVQSAQRFRRVMRSEGVPVAPGFIRGEQPTVIPPHSKAFLLLDYETVTLGFPELTLSGGKEAVVTLRYAENLYNPDRSKGDRNEIAGKHIRGVRDVIVSDGRPEFRFSPTWYRAFRFVQIEVETAGEALVLRDYVHRFTAAPLQRRAVFECDNADYEKIDGICWRTAAICTQDNLMSDAYYEQMMYVGDSWVHAMVNLYMSGESIWLRNAIEQFDFSRMPDGNITACYPLKSTFITPTFSLVWVAMLYDFMMYCDDRTFVKQYVQSIRSTLYWFENNLQENGLVGKPVDGYFVDWYDDADFAGAGIYPGAAKGNSATVTLHYAATLRLAADLFDYIGLPEDATTCRRKAEKVKIDVIAACWDAGRQLFAETPDKRFFDERTNIMAIAAQVFDREEQKKLLARCLDDTTLSKPTYYFRRRHFNEMRRLGEGRQLDKVMDVWKNLLPLHLTTTPERVGKPRSECHPWSAWPAVAFVHVTAGIAPAEPGYKSVNIEPALGTLKYIKASYPHYLGDITVDLKKKGANGIEGSVLLPPGLKGTFIWRGQPISLTGGEQKIDCP